MLDIKPRITKPPFGSVEVDWGHPLSRQLALVLVMNEGGGPPRSALNRFTSTFSGIWVASKHGLATKFVSTSSNFISLPINLSGTNKATVACHMSWDAFANDNKLLSEYTPNYNSGAGLILNPDSSQLAFDVINSAGDGLNYNGGQFTRTSAAVFHHYVFTFDRTTGTALGTQAFVDGVKQVITQTQSNNLAGTNYANSSLFIMSRGGASLFADGQLATYFLWTRVLSDAEAYWAYREPYAFLRPIPAVRYYRPLAGVAAAGAPIAAFDKYYRTHRMNM